MASDNLPRMNHVEERLRRLAQDLERQEELNASIRNQIADLRTLAQPQAWRLLMKTDKHFLRELLRANLPAIRQILDEDAGLRAKFLAWLDGLDEDPGG